MTGLEIVKPDAKSMAVLRGAIGLLIKSEVEPEQITICLVMAIYDWLEFALPTSSTERRHEIFNELLDGVRKETMQ